MRNLLPMLGLGLLLAAVAPDTLAVPKPAIAPRAWELTFRYQDPQRLSLFLPGQDQPVVYWYMLYVVENGNNVEVDFYPEFDLVTDTLQVIHSERRVSPAAFQAIKDRAGDPFLLPPERVTGKLLQGEDRARHGVAVWRDFDPKANSFTIYVGGLSGEWTRVKNPAFEPDRPETDENRRYFILRKTLAIPYRLPASSSLRRYAVPERIPHEQEWVMR